jgi:hypothetical protein
MPWMVVQLVSAVMVLSVLPSPRVYRKKGCPTHEFTTPAGHLRSI